jgi:hypothetical protein
MVIDRSSISTREILVLSSPQNNQAQVRRTIGTMGHISMESLFGLSVSKLNIPRITRERMTQKITERSIRALNVDRSIMQA